MTPIEALLLALLQGVTEFLPISSSAHLILAPYLFGWREHALTFDIVTNAGTLVAAIVYFRRDLVSSLRATEGRRLIGRLAVASLPALAVGAVFYPFFASTAREPLLIGLTTIVFGLLLGWADRAAGEDRGLAQLRWGDALAIGIAQALALIPGTSRSGITITAGLMLGLRREEAARFSFLLAIPIGLVALVKDGYELAVAGGPSDGWLPLALGFIVAAVSAYLVIGWLLAWMRRQSLSIFVVYRLVLGVLVLVLSTAA